MRFLAALSVQQGNCDAADRAFALRPGLRTGQRRLERQTQPSNSSSSGATPRQLQALSSSSSSGSSSRSGGVGDGVDTVSGKRRRPGNLGGSVGGGDGGGDSRYSRGDYGGSGLARLGGGGGLFKGVVFGVPVGPMHGPVGCVLLLRSSTCAFLLTHHWPDDDRARPLLGNLFPLSVPFPPLSLLAGVDIVRPSPPNIAPAARWVDNYKGGGYINMGRKDLTNVVFLDGASIASNAGASLAGGEGAPSSSFPRYPAGRRAKERLAAARARTTRWSPEARAAAAAAPSSAQASAQAAPTPAMLVAALVAARPRADW